MYNQNNIIEGYITDHHDHEKIYKDESVKGCDAVGIPPTPACMYALDKKHVDHAHSHHDYANHPIRNRDLSMFGRWKYDNPHAKKQSYRGVFNVPMFNKLVEHEKKMSEELASMNTNVLVENQDDDNCATQSHPPFYHPPTPPYPPFPDKKHHKPKSDPHKPEPYTPQHQPTPAPTPHHQPTPAPTPHHKPYPIPTPYHIVKKKFSLKNIIKVILIGFCVLSVLFLIIYIFYPKDVIIPSINIDAPINTETKIRIEKMLTRNI